MAAVLSEEPRLEAKVTVNHKQAVDDIQKIVQNHEESANKKKKRRNKKGRFQTCLGTENQIMICKLKNYEKKNLACVYPINSVILDCSNQKYLLAACF